MSEGDTDVARNVLIEVLQDATRTHKVFQNIIRVFVESIFWSGVWEFCVSSDTKIGQIKGMVLHELYGTAMTEHGAMHCLVYPAGKKMLHENKTIKEELAKTEVELELIRMAHTQEMVIKFSQRISEDDIQEATKSLPKPIEKQRICNVILDFQPPEFVSDIRKIMITLIEYSLLLMTTKRNAKSIFNIVRRKLLSENFLVADSMLNQYTNLGSSPRRVKFAVNCSLYVKQKKFEGPDAPFLVTEWLEENKDKTSVLLGLPDSFRTSDSKTIDEEYNETIVLLHLYLRACFKICPKATGHLEEMGFVSAEIQRALRFTGNNTSESVEYLIGNTDEENDGAKRGLDTGMSKTCAMYEVIMSDPEILLPFGNPIILYACLSIVDASSFLISSMRFPTLIDLLNKILTVYYTTKCNLVLRQMIGDTPNE